MELLALYFIIALNVLVSMTGFKALAAGGGEKYLFIPYLVARGENVPGMFVSNLSHANFAHLFMNMLTLFFFGPAVIHKASTTQFLFVYLAAGIGAILIVYFLRKNDPNYRCLGASGSVVGIIFASIVLDPTITVYFHMMIPIPGPLYAIGYLLISIFMMRSAAGGISHEAHIGGAISGFAAAALVAPQGLNPLIQTVSRWLH